MIPEVTFLILKWTLWNQEFIEAITRWDYGMQKLRLDYPNYSFK